MDEIFLDILSNKLNKELSQISIDSYSLLKWTGLGQKPRRIIVKFTLYKDRYHVFRNKKT